MADAAQRFPVRLALVVLALAVAVSAVSGAGLYFAGAFDDGSGAGDGSDPTGNGSGTDDTTTPQTTAADGGPVADAPELSLGVSESGSVEPTRGTIPGIEGSDERPLGRLERVDSGDGTSTGNGSADAGAGAGVDFVADEVVVNADREVARELAARWGGEIRASFEPTEHNMTGDPRYLVAVDTDTIDPVGVEDDVRTLLPNATGDYRVSDERSLRLLAAVAQARTEGYDVEANFVTYAHGFSDGATEEAPDGSGGYRDAYDFAHLNEDETPSIGVTKAWELLEREGMLDEEVRIAVLDNGFATHDDFPEPYLASGGMNEANTAMSCTGGNPCPWHGTKTASAAFAVPDNRYGTAGPAGPVAKPILLPVGGDFFSIGSWIRFAAGSLDADVISISIGAEMPGVSDAFRGGGLESATNDAQRDGALVVVSAGNNGRNVDGEGAFGARENRDWRPCENDGVVCVGGLRPGSVYRDPGSNYGTNHGGPNSVDIYAPYCMQVGPTPKQNADGSWDTENVPNVVGWGCGTSYSAPFVAGVAGLMTAADPTLGPDDLQQILYATAQPSPDDDVHRIVDAHAAVRGAMGYNVPPTAEILTPADGERYALGYADRLVADVDDYEDAHEDTPRSGMPPGILFPDGADPGFEDRIVWRVDGDVAGHGERVELDEPLDVGTHFVEVTVTDAGGKTATDRSTIEVYSRPPQARIESPTDGATFAEGATVTFRAFTNDPDTAEPVDDADVTWRSSRDGSLGSGHELDVSTLSRGTHTITLRAEDDNGGVGAHEITVTVAEACPGGAAGSATIATPANGATVGADHHDDETLVEGRSAWGKALTFQGWGCSPAGTTIDGDDIRWKVQFTADGRSYTKTIGTGDTIEQDLYSYDSCGATEYEVIMQAWDADAGTWRIASHTVTVEAPIC